MNVAPATARQQALYTDLVDVFHAETLAVGVDKRLATNAAGTVDAVPTYENQLCKYFPSSEYNASNMPMGRTLQDNMLTLDRFHFPLGVELRDGDVVLLKTSGAPDEGTYYRVQGNSETWQGTSVRQAKYARVFAKRIPRPVELDS